MGQLEGKNALVTGGTSGIGLAAARRFAAEGAHVFITGRRQEALDRAAATIGDHVTAVRGDVSKLEDLDRLVEVVSSHGGGLDVVMANAGGGEFAPLGAITPEHYADTFNGNVAGTLFTVQKTLPVLNDSAAIVLVGSTAASAGTPAFGVYAASKAAIRSFARTWAAELVGRKIRVNTLIPGPTQTPGVEGLAPTPEDTQGLLDHLASTVPMGRMGQPEEIASAALFLASDQSSFMTGAEIFVDGGAEQI
ncbi:SDR family oxidoreductase [Pedococcus sp. KACC 23699]|uniref:SDR family oxidoreductase n=1 Tax=Pedococcus sp. KACC 23699 TaxID=3149228 RepID=A0AAU7JW12_9MICO